MNNNSILDVAILGAGPGGLSAAARAAQRRISHVVLEASDKHANTIQRYQRLKHVMSEPGMLPLRSDISFKAGTREEILETWERSIAERGIRVQYGAEVVSVNGRKGDFQVQMKSGKVVRARHLVLAIVAQGNPRKLGVPGDNLPCVVNTLASAADHKNEAVVIVGAGDSAIEDALALSRQNRVVLVNRGTASAAEIVSGALQDHDRALIAGETTFGKGLVQTVQPLDDHTGIALTVARYYTPSGRVVQRNYEGVSLYDYYYNRETETHPTETKQTEHGRTVYGGGGITPDVKIPAIKTSYGLTKRSSPPHPM